MSEVTNSNNKLRELAQAAARRGEEFIAAVRTGNENTVKEFLLENSTAAYLFDMFGVALFRLDLRLDQAEAEKLAPYDLQLEGEVGLLELGVLQPLEVEGSEPEEHGHILRLFGSSLLLNYSGDWYITDVLPFNSDGKLNPQNPLDQQITEVHQGRQFLPLKLDRLDETEGRFLKNMQEQSGRFNLEELVNALRMWRDFKSKTTSTKRISNRAKAWAGAVEYLITLFDYHEVDDHALAKRYDTEATDILERARQIAQTLNVTQFDDRYSIHPDPVAHYRAIFQDLGVNPERDRRVLEASQRAVFDTIEEVPDDDEDFFGPR
jgi:hypothetical protein